MRIASSCDTIGIFYIHVWLIYAKNSEISFQKWRSSHLSFGTWKKFYWSILCLKELQSVLIHTMKRIRNWKKKWKRRGMLTYNVSLFHDNVRPHAARLIHDLLVSFGWDIVTHPSYSSQIIIFSIHWRSFWVDNDFQLKRRSRKLSKSGFRW